MELPLLCLLGDASFNLSNGLTANFLNNYRSAKTELSPRNSSLLFSKSRRIKKRRDRRFIIVEIGQTYSMGIPFRVSFELTEIGYSFNRGQFRVRVYCKQNETVKVAGKRLTFPCRKKKKKRKKNIALKQPINANIYIRR